MHGGSTTTPKENLMICAMTARRIADGQTDEFLDAFLGDAEEMPPEIRERFKTVLACRKVDDPEVILTFGMFDGTLDELRSLQSTADRAGQLNKIEPFVQEQLFDGSFEVLRDYIAEASGERMSAFVGTSR
jgi:hypothetical protein